MGVMVKKWLLVFFHTIPVFASVCTEYYKDALYSFFDRYTRPCTVVEIQASKGEVTLSLAGRYPDSVFVMFESTDASIHSACMHRADLQNIIVLTKTTDIETLVRLGECEDPDVILCMHGLINHSHDWEEFIKVLAKIASHLIIAVPESMPGVTAYLQKHGAETIATRLYVLHCYQEKALTRTLWPYRTVNTAEEKLVVTSTYEDKFLCKLGKNYGNKRTTWIPGINLVTYCICQPLYPLCRTIKRSLMKLIDVHHDDWQPKNMILQGNKISLIDYNDARTHKYSPEPLYARRLRCIDTYMQWLLVNPRRINGFFWKRMQPIRTAKKNRRTRDSL